MRLGPEPHFQGVVVECVMNLCQAVSSSLPDAQLISYFCSIDYKIGGQFLPEGN